MKVKSNIKKIKRQGMHNIYNTEHGIIWIGTCTNITVYKKPGYYIECNNLFNLPKELMQRCFTSPLQAVKNVCRFLNGYVVKI